MGQKSDIDVGFNEKIIDEENAIKVIQMLNRQPAFKIENVVTNKNILELLLEWNMWPICVYKEVYIFFKKSFLYISKERF